MTASEIRASIIFINRGDERIKTSMIRRGFREEHYSSPSLPPSLPSLSIYLSLFISAPVGRRSRLFGIVSPITDCHSIDTMKVRLITFRVAASLTHEGCARPHMRGMYISYPTRIRAHSSHNPADIFLARRSLDYRDPSELRITRAATASAYVMTAITCTAFALRNAPQSKHIRLRYQGHARVVYLRRWRSMLFHGREMAQMAFFRSNWYQESTGSATRKHFIITSMYIYPHAMATIFFQLHSLHARQIVRRWWSEGLLRHFAQRSSSIYTRLYIIIMRVRWLLKGLRAAK